MFEAPVHMEMIQKQVEPTDFGASSRFARIENSSHRVVQSNLATFRNIKIYGKTADVHGQSVDTFTARRGETIAVSADVELNLSGFGASVLNQVIVGLEPTNGREPSMKEIGAQECILHACTFQIVPFHTVFELTMPQTPGTYDIRFNNTMEYTPENALSHWSDKSEWLLPPKRATIATVIVE